MIGPVGGMVGGCLVAWAVVAAWYGPAVGRDVALGMAGPLLAVVVTWVLIVRAHRRNPAGVTGVMLQAFFGKVVFFGIFVTGVWTGAHPEPIPFTASFTSSFLALYAVEAVLLNRLSRGGSRT